MSDFIINNYGNEVDPNDLIIFRVLSPALNPLYHDFTILGFKKVAPHYDRGRKTKAEYKCPNYDELVVEKIFNDIRDENGVLVGLEVIFNWYTEGGNIGLTKTEIVKHYNKAEAETEERKRRERVIDFLISEARNTPNEPYINMLTSHYEIDIQYYEDRGSSDFANSMNSETDPTISAILSARVPFTSDNNFTVPIKESILYQINALTEQELLNTLEPIS